MVFMVIHASCVRGERRLRLACERAKIELSDGAESAEVSATDEQGERVCAVFTSSLLKDIQQKFIPRILDVVRKVRPAT
jgi:molecular chaperone DnaK (HSP70)